MEVKVWKSLLMGINLKEAVEIKIILRNECIVVFEFVANYLSFFIWLRYTLVKS